MGDVFLSYRAEDRSRVRPLVAALEAEGLSVWWDAHIEGGTAWRHTLQEQLDAAGVVVVAWSRMSVGPEGRFVHDEASRAQQRGVYLPVLIDRVKPPLGFGEVQALPLIGWRGDRADARFRALLAAIRRRLELARPPRARSAAPPGRSRRLVLGAGAFAAAGLLGAGGFALWRRSGAPADDRSIAVLPFANLSGDPAQAYFADGLAEELRGALARLGQFRVIARASCEAMRDAPIPEAARKLGAANILTGSVRRSPSLIRISAQLVGGSDGVERWSETYDRAPGDALLIQAGIAESVAHALHVRLGEAERAALAVGGTRSAAAHDLILQAVQTRKADGSEAGMRQALSLADAAVAQDPDYATAHLERAKALAALSTNYPADVEDLRVGLERAAAAANRAIALSPRLAGAHSVLAGIRSAQLDLGGAWTAHQRARSAGGEDVDVMRPYGQFLGEIGRAAEGAQVLQKVVGLDPLNVYAHGAHALVLFYGRRYAEAVEATGRALALAPNRPQTFTLRGDCLLQMGKVAEARVEYGKAPADDPFRITGEALAAARLNQRPAAETGLAWLRSNYGDAASYQQAEILAQLGETDPAFDALNRALAVRDGGLLAVRADPFIDPLRGDPRLRALEQRLNFPQGDGGAA